MGALRDRVVDHTHVVLGGPGCTVCQELRDKEMDAMRNRVYDDINKRMTTVQSVR